ncbi:hypothetical protein [Methylocystis echinoides]|uniref:hypothetical protein n=1 Tax=Methylocystis echinoides TaxID=29468 RepID=UPI00343EEDB5
MVNISQGDFDHEREVAYRRGFARGMSEAISGMDHKLSNEEREVMRGWFKKALTAWARSSTPSCMIPPPVFPSMRDSA